MKPGESKRPRIQNREENKFDQQILYILEWYEWTELIEGREDLGISNSMPYLIFICQAATDHVIPRPGTAGGGLTNTKTG